MHGLRGLRAEHAQSVVSSPDSSPSLHSAWGRGEVWGRDYNYIITARIAQAKYLASHMYIVPSPDSSPCAMRGNVWLQVQIFGGRILASWINHVTSHALTMVTHLRQKNKVNAEEIERALKAHWARPS